MTGRKITAMHNHYGVVNEKNCGQCPWLYRSCGYGKSWYKCAAYGNSNSEATDWRKKWTACGLIDGDINGLAPMLEILKHESRKEPEKPLKGQIDMFGGVYDD